MAKKRTIPNIVEEIAETTKQVSKETEAMENAKNDVQEQKQAHDHVQAQAQVYVQEYEQIKKPEIRSERLPIMMTPTMKRRLKKAADAKGISMSEIIYNLTEQFLDEIES